MDAKRMTGPGAGSLKYDLLTALAVAGFHEGGVGQMSLLRLSALLTARYNWGRDAVTIGQADLALLWAVDPRTVKREIKRLTEAGLMTITRPGRRGRVASYRVHVAAICQRTKPHWDKVGFDFVDRMSGHLPAERQNVVQVNFSPAGETPAPEPGLWGAVSQRLQVTHPEVWSSWYARLRMTAQTADRVELTAPNRFVGSYVETHLMEPLAMSFAQICQRPMRVAIAVEP